MGRLEDREDTAERSLIAAAARLDEARGRCILAALGGGRTDRAALRRDMMRATSTYLAALERYARAHAAGGRSTRAVG